jgi:hypothetical protein
MNRAEYGGGDRSRRTIWYIPASRSGVDPVAGDQDFPEHRRPAWYLLDKHEAAWNSSSNALFSTFGVVDIRAQADYSARLGSSADLGNCSRKIQDRYWID